MTKATEVTPLLAASSEGPTLQGDAETLDIHHISNATKISDVASNTDSEQAQQPKDDDKPLPKAQILLLCVARVVEPIAFFGIFPYINQMIETVGDVTETDVGFYSGLIESLFSLTQMFFMISWGRAADRFGRRPVLIVSVIGVSITTCLFGLSKSIWQMVLFRCLAGVFSGTIVTVRTMLSENTTLKTQARAFSWYAFSNNLGILIGPIIGGALSNPATQYPGVFGWSSFLHNYPYALPSLISGAIGLSAAVLCTFFLKETLASKQTGKESTDPPMSSMEIIKQPGVPMTLFLWCFVCLCGLANTAVLPVFWFTSVRLGGLGFSPIQISIFLGLAGISQAIWLLFIFPPAQRRWGTRSVTLFAGILFPISIVCSPIESIFLRHGLKPAFWTLMPLGLIVGSGGAMSFTTMQLAVNNISPSPAVLGTLNAISLAMTSGIRAIAPGLFSSLFATGVRTQVLDGYLVWVVMVLMTSGLAVSFRYLPEKAEGKIVTNDENEEEAL